MNPDARDEENSNAPGSSKGTAWVGGSAFIVVVYLMSPIFMLKAIVVSGGSRKPSIVKCFKIVYAPAIALYEHCKPYQKLLDAEMKWLGVH